MPYENRFTGNIDNCLFKTTPEGVVKIYIEGWLLHKSSKIVSLRLGQSEDRLSEARLVHRPDVAAMLPEIPHAFESGFVTVFETPLLPTQMIDIVLLASLDDGRVVRSFLKASPIKLSPKIKKDAQTSPYGSTKSRAEYLKLCNYRFKAFLSSGERISFPKIENPLISIVVVTFNRAGLSYACFQSLCEQKNISYEIIIVDNASTDLTNKLLERIDGAKIIKNQKNDHFLKASNMAAASACGQYILFLNNDCALLPGALNAALRCFSEIESIGCLGARLIRPDGLLQEAGSMLFKDGSSAAIGNGDDPFLPVHSRRKEVEYCSGAFFMTPRALWEELGGFDEAFAPAYYEDADYCIRARESGKKIIYEPEALAIHPEHGGKNDPGPAALMHRNKQIFVQKHSDLFSTAETRTSISTQIESFPQKKAILFIDDFIPRREIGQGCPRSEHIIHELAALGFDIGIIALNEEEPNKAEAHGRSMPGVSLSKAVKRKDLQKHLLDHIANYASLWVSRPHNMEEVAKIRNAHPWHFEKLKVIYDAEAVFAMRDILKLELEHGIKLSSSEVMEILAEELAIVRHADVVVSVSEHEARRFRDYGCNTVFILGHAEEHAPQAQMSHTDRIGILSVGPILEDDSPNGDGFLWFTRKVLPLVDRVYKAHYHFFIHAGLVRSEQARASESAHVRLPGFVPDLGSLYLSSRIFVAPTRFSAGIPIKVIEAASHGVPCVVTPILAEQLGWTEGSDFLVASTEEGFALQCAMLYKDETLWSYISTNASARVASQYSGKTFSLQLKKLLDSVFPVMA